MKRFVMATVPTMKPFRVVKSVFKPSIATQHVQPTTTSPSTASTTSDPATKPHSSSHANESVGDTAGAAVETRIRWIRHHHCRGRNYDRNRPSTSTNTTTTPTSPTTTTSTPPESLPLRRMLCWPGTYHSRRIQLSREGSGCGGRCHHCHHHYRSPLADRRTIDSNDPAPYRHPRNRYDYSKSGGRRDRGSVDAELRLLGKRKYYGRGRAEELPERAAADVRVRALGHYSRSRWSELPKQVGAILDYT